MLYKAAYCLSNAIHCMGQNIKSLAASVCVSVKVVTPKCLGSIILKTAGDTDLVTIEHLQEMAHGVSNGHMTDDVT